MSHVSTVRSAHYLTVPAHELQRGDVLPTDQAEVRRVGSETGGRVRVDLVLPGGDPYAATLASDLPVAIARYTVFDYTIGGK